MYAQVEKPKDNKSRAIANSVAQKKSNGKPGFGFVDTWLEVVAQKKFKVSPKVIQMMIRRTPILSKIQSSTPLSSFNLTVNPKKKLGPRLTGGNTIYSYVHWNSSDGPHSLSSVFIDTMIAFAEKNGKLKHLANDILPIPNQNRIKANAYFHSKSNTHSQLDMNYNMKYYNDDYEHYFDKALKGDAGAIRKAYNLRAGGVTSVAPKEKLSLEQMKGKGERWNNALEDINKISNAKNGIGKNLNAFIKSEGLKNVDKSKSNVFSTHILDDLRKINKHHKKVYNIDSKGIKRS